MSQRTETEKLFTLSFKQKVVIALAVIAWAVVLDQAADVNFAAPLVKAEQGR